MSALYFISVWLHILAAIIWIGGVFFISLVIVPWIRRAQNFKPSQFLNETGKRFRAIGWACFSVLFITGMFNLWFRGIRVSDFNNLEWLNSSYGHTIILKLGLFIIVLLNSALHDFILGPKAISIMQSDPNSLQTQSIRKRASVLGRINALLALLLLTTGIAIVRGWP